MTLFRQIAACVFLMTGAFPIAFNFASIFMNARRAIRKIPGHVSMAPVVGPLLGSFGIGLWRDSFDVWLAIPWLVDPASWLLLVSIAYGLRPRWD